MLACEDEGVDESATAAAAAAERLARELEAYLRVQSGNTCGSGSELQPPGGFGGGERKDEHGEEEDLEVDGEAPPENRPARRKRGEQSVRFCLG